jgi:hypothetical protein
MGRPSSAAAENSLAARVAMAHRLIGVEATRQATRGSKRLTVTVARHEDGGGDSAQQWSEAVLRGMACGSDMPCVSRKKRG